MFVAWLKNDVTNWRTNTAQTFVSLQPNITWHDIPQRVKVIGIVKDAIMASPFSPAEPTIFAYTPGWSNVITYRLSSNVGTQ